MDEEQVSYPAAGLARRRGFRCLVSALFTAAVSLSVVSLFTLVAPGKQAYFFFLVLGVSFAGAQIQERMHNLAS